MPVTSWNIQAPRDSGNHDTKTHLNTERTDTVDCSKARPHRVPELLAGAELLKALLRDDRREEVEHCVALEVLETRLNVVQHL